MRLAAAIVAITIGASVSCFGLWNARQDRLSGPDAAMSRFANAFIAGDAATMATLFASASDADHASLPTTAMPGVRVSLKPAEQDAESAAAEITFLSDGSFLRGRIFATRENGRWLILGLRFETPEPPNMRVGDFTQLNAMPGVSVSPIPESAD